MAAAIAAMVVSCQKEDMPEVVKTEPMVITAGAETKTVLDGTNVLWTAGDKIMVFDNLDGKEEFSDENLSSNSTTANFAGNVTAGTEAFLAVYPSTCVSDGSTYKEVVVTIPSVQTPKAGSFETNHNISVASGKKDPGEPSVGEVQFMNICGLLKFTLPTSLENIAKVSISSTSPIAGAVKVLPTEDGINTTFEGTECMITMNPGEGKVFTFPENGVNTFWFTLAPVTLKDLTISVSTNKGYTYSMKKIWSDDPLVIEAGKFRNLGNLVMKQAAVSAVHTTNANGQLDGTMVSINLPDKAENIALNIKKDGNIVWGDIALLEVKGSEHYSSYPYLPQGTYQLSGTYTIADKGTEVQLGTTTFTVPAPTFTVTPAQARTTYTVATSAKLGGATAANSLDPLKITNLHDGVTPGISDNILQKYANLIGGVTTKIVNNATTIETSATSYDFLTEYIQKISTGLIDFSSMTDRANAYDKVLGTNNVTSSYTFDNAKCDSDVVVYYITGLPYMLDYTANDGGWREATFGSNGSNFGKEVKWNKDGGVRIGENSSGESDLTRKFYTPEDRSVVVSVDGYVNTYVELNTYWEGWKPTMKFECDPNTGTVSLSGVSIYSATVDSNDSFTKDDIKSGKSEDLSPKQSVTTTLTSANPTIRFHNSTSGPWRYFHIRSFSITY